MLAISWDFLDARLMFGVLNAKGLCRCLMAEVASKESHFKLGPLSISNAAFHFISNKGRILVPLSGLDAIVFSIGNDVTVIRPTSGCLLTN